VGIYKCFHLLEVPSLSLFDRKPENSEHLFLHNNFSTVCQEKVIHIPPAGSLLPAPADPVRRRTAIAHFPSRAPSSSIAHRLLQL
jgi:hypothetical protein